MSARPGRPPHPREALFRENWKSIAASSESRAALAAELKVLDAWLERAMDPEQGTVGAQLHAAFRATGCREHIRADRSPGELGLASYASFSTDKRAQKTTMENAIHYTPDAFTSRACLFSTRVHEMIHAIQFRKAPALHAHIGNFNTPVILCPRDQALLTKYMEQDAYAKQAWMASLMVHEIPEDDPVRASAPLELFAWLRGRAGNVTAAISAISEVVMSMANFFTVSGGYGPDWSLAQTYCHKKLLRYEELISSRMDDIRAGTVTLARLDTRDIWEVGNSFGPNIFGAEPPPSGILMPPDLHPDTVSLLARLNGRLGITDENALPAFTDALRARGMSGQDLIDRSFPPQRTWWQSIRQAFGRSGPA